MSNGERKVPRFDIPVFLGGDPVTGDLRREEPVELDPGTGVLAEQVTEEELPPLLGSKLNLVGGRTAATPPPEKTGTAKEIGSVAIEGTPPPDPRLEQELVAQRGADAQLEQAQLQAQAISLGIESNIQESFSQGLASNYEQTIGKVNQLLTDAETELAAVDDLIQRARSNQVNPGQFFANVGDAGKFAAAIAIGAGAMASAFGGGDNVAYDVISRAIDRNVRAQVVNQQHNRALISHQLQYVHGIRGMAGDHANLGNITRAALTAIVQAQLEQTRSTSASQVYALGAERVIARFGADMVEAAIKARQNIKFKYQMKFHNEAQVDRRTAVAQASLENAALRATGQIPTQKQPARLPTGKSPAAATPPQRGPAPKPTTAAPQTQGDAAAAIQAAESNPEFAGLDAKAQARLIARNFQENASVQRKSGDAPNSAEIDEVWKAIDPTGKDPVAQALRALPDTDFTPVRESSSVAINVPGAGTRHLRVRDEAAWADISQSEKSQIIDEMTSSIAAEGMATELHRLVGLFSRGKGILGDLMRRGPDGELVFPLFASGPDSATIAKLDLVGRQLANLKRLEKGSDAVRNVSEWELWEKLASGEITTRQQIVDILRGDPKVRQFRILPFIEFERQNVLRLGTPHFTNFD